MLLIACVSEAILKSFNPRNPNTDNMKYQDLTRKIIGCAMKVHSTLGNGFQEVIYQRALAIELQKQGMGSCVKWR